MGMADLFDCTCRTCGRSIYLLDEKPDSDAEKIARMSCFWCTSKDVTVEPLNDTYFEANPDAPRPNAERYEMPDDFLEQLRTWN